jgi:hypothetical protein
MPNVLSAHVSARRTAKSSAGISSPVLDRNARHVGDQKHAERLDSDVAHDPMWKCFGSQLSGNSCFYLGKLTDVRAYLKNAISLWDPRVF